MDRKKTFIACFAILFMGAAVTLLIFSTEPTALRSGATKKTAILVDVTSVQQGTYQPTIQAMGTVTPAKNVILSPRVNGEIVRRSQSFTPGGLVKKGEVLLQIDPADYKNRLQQQKSVLSQAISDLNIEMGRQVVAQKDYQLLGDTLSDRLSEKNKLLVLRKPQLDAARAQVQSARAAVEQAELDLERTTIRAPFDAHIISRNVNIGSQVAPGDNLGRLVGMDTYWVEATLPLSKLRWLTFPDDEGRESSVKITNSTAWGSGQYRQGKLYKLVGALENQTRMARVLITIADPFAHEADRSNTPALIIGSFVEATIKAKKLANVIRLNRDYIREDDAVWVMKNSKLQIHEVNIVFRDAQYAYITEGLSEQDQVVTTNLSTVTEGVPLRLGAADSSAKQDTLFGE